MLPASAPLDRIEEPPPSAAPARESFLARRRPLFVDNPRCSVFDLAGLGIGYLHLSRGARGGAQVAVQPVVLVPPEGLPEARPVLRVAQYGGDDPHVADWCSASESVLK